MKTNSQILHLNGVFITTLLFLGLTSESVKAVSLTFSFGGASATIDFSGSSFKTADSNDPRLNSLPFIVTYSSTLREFNLTVDSKSPSVFESDIDQSIAIKDTFWQGNINIAISAGSTDVLTNLSGSFRHTPGEFIVQPDGKSVFVNRQDLPDQGDAASGNPFSINFGRFSGADTNMSINRMDMPGVEHHPSIPHFDNYSRNRLTLTVDTNENEFSALNYVLIGGHSIPEPTSTLSLLALGTLGTASTLKRRLKHKPEKDTIKVGS